MDKLFILSYVMERQYPFSSKLEKLKMFSAPVVQKSFSIVAKYNEK